MTTTTLEPDALPPVPPQPATPVFEALPEGPPPSPVPGPDGGPDFVPPPPPPPRPPLTPFTGAELVGFVGVVAGGVLTRGNSDQAKAFMAAYNSSSVQLPGMGFPLQVDRGAWLDQLGFGQLLADWGIGRETFLNLLGANADQAPWYLRALAGAMILGIGVYGGYMAATQAAREQDVGVGRSSPGGGFVEPE